MAMYAGICRSLVVTVLAAFAGIGCGGGGGISLPTVSPSPTIGGTAPAAANQSGTTPAAPTGAAVSATALTTATFAVASTQPTAQPTRAATQPVATVRPTASVTSVAPTSVASQAAGGNVAAGDACGLLTKDEAAAALGEAVNAPKPASVPPLPVAPGVTLTPSACDYDAVSSPGHVRVTLFQSTGGSAAQSQQFRQIICGGKEQVTGLGEVACWYSAQHRELQVFPKAGILLDIEMVIAGKDVSEQVKTLARQVLGRLP